MRLYRCVPWWGREADFPRRTAGGGRHDAPALYGCLYASLEPVSALVEQLARFRGTSLAPGCLVLGGSALALADLELPDDAPVLDLDDPIVLAELGLRPSRVASRVRRLTQADAATLYERRPETVALRWPSVYDPRWTNVTVFDRAAGLLQTGEVRRLSLADDALRAAAAFLGLPIST